MLVKRSTVKKFRMDIILKPVVQELQTLAQEGVDFLSKNGVRMNMKVVLNQVCGDNLSMHEVCGLFQNFALASVCRYCDGLSEDIQMFFKPEEFLRRDKRNHELNLRRIQKDSRIASLTGILRPRVLRTRLF